MLSVVYVQSHLQVVTIGCLKVCMYAGGTLVRREKKNLDHAIRLCLCMIRMLDGSFRLYIHVLACIRHGVFWGTASV